jgi:SAM-dependent methyltransferase
MTSSEPEAIVGAVASYYSAKLREHGPTARGVDWNSEESQRLRFERLLEVCEPSRPMSLNDYGCGYGALVDFLRQRGEAFRYVGYDVAPAMIEAARQRYPGASDCRFTARLDDLSAADYTVASGIFNVKLDVADADWQAYVLASLDQINALSARGFAFNALTAYSDAERKRPDLHYADPLALFDHCKRHYSRRVALLHDYPLWEFTLVVRK